MPHEGHQKSSRVIFALHRLHFMGRFSCRFVQRACDPVIHSRDNEKQSGEKGPLTQGGADRRRLSDRFDEELFLPDPHADGHNCQTVVHEVQE
jgi:hypothetical protein